MHRRAKKGIAVALATGGLLFTSSSIALADAGAWSSTNDDNGVLTGNNVNVPINLPITVCGNSIAVLGIATNSACHITGDDSGGSAWSSASADHDNGVAAGNNVQVPINAPITVCGNSIAVVGLAANSACDISGDSDDSVAAAHSTQNDDNGVLTGNGVNLPVNLPVTICGNSVGVVGVAANSACSLGHPTAPPTMPPCCHPPTMPPTTPPATTTPTVPVTTTPTVPVTTTPTVPVTTTPTVPVTTTPTTPTGTPTLPGPSASGTSTGGPSVPGENENETPPPSAASLAHTGADVMGLVAAGGALILGGVGLTRVAARRKH